MKKFQYIVFVLVLSMALVLTACQPTATPEPAPVEETEPVVEPTAPPEPTAVPPTPEPTPEPAIGSEEHPIKVLFVPSVNVDFMISSGDLIAQALNEATGLFFEVAVPTSYAATIEEMCASPTDTIGFIPALGYALASQ